MSRLKSYLEKLTGLEYLSLDAAHYVKSGGSNDISFAELKEVKLRRGEENASMQVAIAKPKDPSLFFVINSAQKVLSERLKDDDWAFILPNVSYRDERVKATFFNYYYPFMHHEGWLTKVCLRASDDLNEFIRLRKAPADREFYRKCIAQMILAVEILHKHHLAHGDIKLSNYFIFRHPNDTIVKLADTDSVCAVTSVNGFAFRMQNAFTDGYLAPEGRDMLGINITNRKALDCYALGMSIAMFIKCGAEFINDEEFEQVSSLVERLMDPDPDYRMTIVEAKQHPFFGVNEKTRSNYFADIKANALKIEKGEVDGFYGSINGADAFYFLPGTLIKPLYIALQHLDTQLDHCHMENCKDDVTTFKTMLTIIESQAEKVQTLINNLLKETLTQHFQHDLEAIQQTITTCIYEKRQEVQAELMQWSKNQTQSFFQQQYAKVTTAVKQTGELIRDYVMGRNG